MDFYDGVYRRHLIRGPARLRYVIDRNNSFNTIISSVFIDRCDPLPGTYYAGGMRSDLTAKVLAPMEVVGGVVLEIDRQMLGQGDAVVRGNARLESEMFRAVALEREIPLANVDVLAGYYAGDFVAYERGLIGMGIITPRAIEAHFRWERGDSWTGREAEAFHDLCGDLFEQRFQLPR